MRADMNCWTARSGSSRLCIRLSPKLEQMVTMKDGRAVATTLTLQQSLMDVYVFKLTPNLAPWAVSRFPTQVMMTYEEISQGKPYGEIAGGK